MLKKRCDLQTPSFLSNELSNAGRPSSPRSSSLQGSSPRSIFAVEAPLSPTAMVDWAKNLPCASPRNPLNGSGRSCGGGPVTGLAGVLVDGEDEQGCCGKNGRVLLGMRLRVQLPSEKGIAGGGGEMLPSSPIEFGVKNRDAQLALLSRVQRPPLSPAARAVQSEVELAEDYTCVIARGPNPKMTHIFDDLVIESCGGGAGDGGGGDACRLLSSCYGCKKSKDAPLPAP